MAMPGGVGSLVLPLRVVSAPAPISPVPVLAAVALLRTSSAAAISRALVTSRPIPEAPSRVGRRRYESPAAAEFTTILIPSATKGLAAVPAPLRATLAPVSRSVSDQLAPSNAIR